MYEKTGKKTWGKQEIVKYRSNERKVRNKKLYKEEITKEKRKMMHSAAKYNCE